MKDDDSWIQKPTFVDRGATVSTGLENRHQGAYNYK